MNQIPGSVVLPPFYKQAYLDEILSTDLLDRLFRSYVEVYGSDETNRDGQIMWGEGAYCSMEGWSKTIPLKEYRNRAVSGNLGCECGGVYTPCYTVESFRQRLTQELSAGALGDDPFLFYLEDGQTSDVAAFTWGALCSPVEVGRRLIGARYKDPTLEVQRSISELVGVLTTISESRFLFYDEMAVMPQSRKGLEPVHFLTRLSLEYAVPSTSNGLFWTVSRSPIDLISRLMGYRPIITIDSLTFLVNSDLQSLLDLLRRKEPIQIQALMAKRLRALRAKG